VECVRGDTNCPKAAVVGPVDFEDILRGLELDACDAEEELCAVWAVEETAEVEAPFAGREEWARKAVRKFAKKVGRWEGISGIPGRRVRGTR